MVKQKNYFFKKESLMRIIKPTFTKIYWHYGKILWKNIWWPILLLVFYASSSFSSMIYYLRDSFTTSQNWKDYLGSFAIAETLQSLLMMIFCSYLITKLSSTKKNIDDYLVCTFVSPLNRTTIVAAKLAIVATYYFSANFLLLVCPLTFYLVNFAGSSWSIAFIFLFLQSSYFAILGFFFFIPLLFYLQETSSFFGFLFFFLINFSIICLSLLNRTNFSQVTLPLLVFLVVPLVAGLTGLLFLRLYWKSFLAKDLD